MVSKEGLNQESANSETNMKQSNLATSMFSDENNENVTSAGNQQNTNEMTVDILSPSSTTCDKNSLNSKEYSVDANGFQSKNTSIKSIKGAEGSNAESKGECSMQKSSIAALKMQTINKSPNQSYTKLGDNSDNNPTASTCVSYPQESVQLEELQSGDFSFPENSGENSCNQATSIAWPITRVTASNSLSNDTYVENQKEEKLDESNQNMVNQSIYPENWSQYSKYILPFIAVGVILFILRKKNQ